MHGNRPAFLTDMGLLMFLAVTASLLGCCQTDEKVSFYGASYIHLPVQEAKGATDISFRFRTHLADAMLLLAAGKTDYCLIKLEAGRLKRTKKMPDVGLIKFVKKIVKKDEGRINGHGKKCNGSSGGLVCLLDASGGLKALLSGDNPAIQSLIAVIYRGIARLLTGGVIEPSVLVV
ncbi:Chondroitin sulfate proteoglycan [Ooceraea biroi]|uniref:Chondroitin sulfate proteoglycan n=1 Tax=Ooceraea biroi TaxID=2015173 RepID=A0A026WHG4_OOCBI|nr:Chondroitin sulfate proteoglycan [Ooceraea biroi]